MFDAHFFECLTFDYINLSVFDWKTVHWLYGSDRVRIKFFYVTIIEGYTIDAAADCIWSDFKEIHLQKITFIYFRKDLLPMNILYSICGDSLYRKWLLFLELVSVFSIPMNCSPALILWYSGIECVQYSQRPGTFLEWRAHFYNFELSNCWRFHLAAAKQISMKFNISIRHNFIRKKKPLRVISDYLVTISTVAYPITGRQTVLAIQLLIISKIISQNHLTINIQKTDWEYKKPHWSAHFDN